MVEERSAFKSAMQSLSSQFMAFAEPEILKTSVRNIVLGSVLAAASVAAMAQGGNDPAVLSKNSASRWSEMLGGAMAGEATKGVFGKGVAGRVFTGVASEMGRNSAKILIGGAYGDSQQQQEQGSGRGVGGSPLTAQQSDHLDTLALRSVFAYEKYKQNEPQGMVSSSRLRAMSAPFVNQRKQFDMAYRAARCLRQSPQQCKLARMQRQPAPPDARIAVEQVQPQRTCIQPPRNKLLRCLHPTQPASPRPRLGVWRFRTTRSVCLGI